MIMERKAEPHVFPPKLAAMRQYSPDGLRAVSGCIHKASAGAPDPQELELCLQWLDQFRHPDLRGCTPMFLPLLEGAMRRAGWLEGWARDRAHLQELLGRRWCELVSDERRRNAFLEALQAEIGGLSRK